MAKWRCAVCGYVYDEEKGDSRHEIDPGTKFDDLPGDWVCPICGASKELFDRIG